MPIDKNQVKKVAKLSRISLDDNKIDSLSKDLDSISTFVERLNELDTKDIKTLEKAVYQKSDVATTANLKTNKSDSLNEDILTKHLLKSNK